MSSNAIGSRVPVVAVDAPSFGPLLASLGIPIGSRVAAAPDAFRLVEVDGVLELRPPDALDRRGIRAEFPPDRGRYDVRSHPLVRAFGRDRQQILDATAGLGGDAYRLAEAGHRVVACEREPAVAALLISGWDGARRAGRLSAETAERLEVRYADATECLADFGGEASAVYLDPMYPPPRRASALPRRELQVLRRLLGPDEDASRLLALARTRVPRVVVKRPTHAAPLAAGASFEVESKLVRFDVYLDPGIPMARQR